MIRNQRLIAVGLVLGLSSFVACSDPTTDKPAAKVAAPAAPAEKPVEKPAATPEAAVVTESLTVSSDTSKILFVGSKVTGSHEGSFQSFSGTIELADGKATGGSVNLDIDMSSVLADDERLTGHLKSGDFFDIENNPKATFKSTSVTDGGEAGATHTITGDLTLRGVTKQISFPATITVTPEMVTATSEFSINRQDFGVVYAGKPDDLIRDNVLLKLDINVQRAM